MSTFLLKYNKIVYVYVVQWMCVFGSHPVKMCEHGKHQVQYEDFISLTGKGFLCTLIRGLRNRVRSELLALSRKCEIIWNVHAV